MRGLLGLGLLVLACGSTASESGAGGVAGESAVNAGGETSGAGHAGWPSTGGGEGALAGSASTTGAMANLAGSSMSGSSAGGSSGESGAVGGGSGGISAGRSAGGGSTAGTSGSHVGGSDTSGAGEGGESAGGGDAGAGGQGGSSSEPDPCESVAHWSPTETWPNYEANARRVFGGILWKCTNATFCQSYPGPASPGWLEVTECAGGPKNEVAACQCQAGTCCDGCYFRPTNYFCGEVVRSSSCINNSVDKDYWNLFCSGDTGGDCSRWGAHTKYTTGSCGALTCAAGACVP
jgi:hypothetical protein